MELQSVVDLAMLVFPNIVLGTNNAILQNLLDILIGLFSGIVCVILHSSVQSFFILSAPAPLSFQFELGSIL